MRFIVVHDGDTGAPICSFALRPTVPVPICSSSITSGVDGKVKQRVLLRLGRLDELLASGQLDSLIQSLGRFSDKLAVLGAHARGDSIITHSARIGPALIFQRLWQARSIDKVLTTLLADRRFEFSVERAIFLTVLHRLFAPGSDRAAEKWKDDYAIEGVERSGLAPSLPRHGLAGRGSSERPAGRGHALRSPHQQGPH